MRKIILKYRTDLPGGETHVPMGEHSRIISVQNQDGHITAWVEHAALDRITHTKVLVSVPTGMDFEADDMSFLGTVQIGAYVWHVYERVSGTVN